jgi:SAM-dependent methyltransferase
MKLEQFKVHADLEEKHWWFLGRRRIMRLLVNHILPPSKTTSVIDIGCGTGANIAALAQDYSCVGIDTSEEAIQFARQRFPNVQFVCGTAPDDLGETGKQSDLFLLMDVLEHIAEDGAFLSKLVAAAKPGAHILVTVPAEMALWTEHDVSFGHLRRYDMPGLQRLWATLPVTPILVSYYNTFLYPIVKGLRALGRLRGRTWGLAGTDFRVPMWPFNGILERIFTSEARVLIDVLRGKRERGFSRGVSLIALLRKSV